MADRNRNREPEEKPEAARLDWDLVGSEPVAANDEEGPVEGEQPGDLPEEDDDNPYQESDEALPDDAEEKVIDRNPGREETRFDDV
jgi:hypothetical protein